jgi:PST family polysaccharide transporter
VPVAQIVVRNDLNTLYGWNSVGYWLAVVRLSDAYILFVTTALTAYYLPRLSQLKTPEDIKREIIQANTTLMPILALALILIYVFRGFIINLLYSQNFGPSTELFTYQLLGDFFRIAGWLFTYLLIAKSWTKTYVLTEIILSLIFITIAHYFSRTWGLVGVTYAFALTYFIYWLMMAGIGLISLKQKDS